MMRHPAPVPDLPEGEVHVWQVDLAREAGPGDWDVLSPGERQRASRFAFDRDRRRYVRAHAAMRQVLGAYLAREPRDLAFTTDAYGKPHLAGRECIAFNLSHGGDVAMVALGTADAIGVDVEPSGRRPGLRKLAESVFTPAEIDSLAGRDEDSLAEAFLRAWTRKEAFLKAIGLGLAHEPRRVHVGTDAQRRRICLTPGGSGPCAEVASLSCEDAVVAAVAVVGSWREVVLRPWPAEGPGRSGADAGETLHEAGEAVR